MPESGRSRDVRGLTASELERIRRELRASLALARPDSLARVPILAHLSAIDAELAERAQTPDIMKLTPDQLATIGQLSDQMVVPLGQAAVPVDRRRGLSRW